MKIARYELLDGTVRVGLVEGDQVRDLPGGITVLQAAAERPTPTSAARALHEVRLLAPVPRPRKILGIGLNYTDHVVEGGPAREAPAFPVFFNKQVSSLAGPFDAIVRPRVSAQLDYEGELVVVIGRTCRRVAETDALRAVAGYMIGNDVSVRDWQRLAPTLTLGKSFDTHCPTGPWLVTPDEIVDPYKLQVRTSVGEEILQSFTTANMIHRIEKQIAILSTAFTLEPGDLILTGTGAGVAFFRKPQRWLVPGERVRVEITALGAIENPVVDEEAGAT